MIEKIIPHFPNLEYFSWLYSKPDHGKGLVDGVRTTLKRIANRQVENG